MPSISAIVPQVMNFLHRLLAKKSASDAVNAIYVGVGPASLAIAIVKTENTLDISHSSLHRSL
jgi:hypothetical protein